MQDDPFKTYVEYNCKVITRLNTYLIKRQSRTDEDVEKIKNLHIFKHLIFEKMKGCPEEDLAQYNEYVVACEYALQRAWGFPEDANYHRFWNTPRCCCPVDDNELNYTQGPYYYNLDCPVHKA